MLQINNHNELWKYAIDLISGEAEMQPVILSDNFNYHIRLHGEFWDEKIDYRIAQLVLELQKAIKDIYNETSGEVLDLNKIDDDIKELLIKVTLKKGSADIVAALKGAFEKMINKMNGKEAVISVAIIASAFLSYYSYDRHMNYKEKALQYTNQAQVVEKLSEIALSQADIIERSQVPTKIIINKMKEHDTIEFVNKGKRFTFEESKDLFPRKPRTKPDNYYIDDEYIVLGINFDEENVHLDKNGYDFWANYNDLSSEDVRTMHNVFEQSRPNRVLPKLNIQLTARVKKGKLYSAIATGLGEKRNGSTNINDLLKGQPDEDTEVTMRP